MTQPGTPGWSLNPVGLLALCPLLAAGGTLITAVCVALLFLVSLILVAVAMAVLGRCIAPESRILTLLLVSGAWVTLLDQLLQAFAYPLSVTLGVYVPLIAVNSLLLTVGEQSLRCGGPKLGAQAGIVPGLYAALWIVPLGLIREILGTGALLSDSQLLPGLPDPLVITTFTAPLLQTAPGAFLVLALAGAWVAGRHTARA
jgi:electron transport complex protein RnfE